MAYENLGNFEYTHEPREYHKAGLITDPNLVLKLYNMHIKGIPLQNALIQRSMNVLENEVRSGSITPLSGLGFAILSEDMLNVARWDDKHPIVLKNQIYENKSDEFKPVDIREVGPFCVHELEVVGHERDEWIKYLLSGRNEEDKSKYLDSFYEGSLDENRDILRSSIFDHKISTRLRNKLLECRIDTVSQALDALKKGKIKYIRGFGKETEKELKNLLKNIEVLN